MNDLYLDIGTEALKIYSNNECSVIYFKETTLFDKKSILEKELKKINKNSAILTGSIISSKIENFSFQRKNPEKKIIKKEKDYILKQAEKELLKNNCNGEIEILEIKIQGYQVKELLNYTGEKIKIKFLVNIFEKIDLFEKIFKNLKVLSLAEIVPLKDSCFILDIGGEKTQVFEIEDEKIINLFEIQIGGKFFTDILTNNLNLNSKDARILKEKYADKKLSFEVEEKIKILFEKNKKDFQNKFDFLNKPVYLLGGGSLLPEIKSFFKGKYLWELKNINNMVKSNIQAQCFSCLLLKNYGKEIF